MLSVLGERIHDGRFLRLIAGLLEAGYLEEWVYNATLSGTPQGGVISPILSNIYLDRLDKFVETVLLPANNHGERRKPHKPYMALLNAARRLDDQRKHDEAEGLRQQVQRMPSRDPQDAIHLNRGHRLE